RIDTGSGSSGRGLGVTAAAAIEIEARTESIGHIIDLQEGHAAGVKGAALAGGEGGQRLSGGGRTAARGRAGLGAGAAGGSEDQGERERREILHAGSWIHSNSRMSGFRLYYQENC